MVPYEVCAEYQLDEADVARYKLAVLPARAVVSTSAATWLDRFREAGGAIASDGAPESLDGLFAEHGSLALSFTDHLSMKLTFSLTFDAEPPAGLKPLDTTTKTTLQVSF